MKVEFGYSSVEDTVQLVELFYERKFPKFDKKHLEDCKFTAAEIYNICFQEELMEDAIGRLMKSAGMNPLSQSVPVFTKSKE